MFMFHCDSLAKRIKWFTFPFAIHDSLSAFLFPAFRGSSKAMPVLRTWFPRVSSPSNVAKAYKSLPKLTGCFIATLESKRFSFASHLSTAFSLITLLASQPASLSSTFIPTN